MQLRKRQRCDYCEEGGCSDTTAASSSNESEDNSEPCGDSSDWEIFSEGASDLDGADKDRTEQDASAAADHASQSSKAAVDAALASHSQSQALSKLTVAVLREYLRDLGLRTTGLKAELIQRVQGHSSLGAQSPGGTPATVLTHPQSSFNLSCVGDVCKGDTVLFKQKVYAGFDVTTRMGNFLGHRMVAGRVIKESYGAQKQQHTFSIEVLWSDGVQALQPFNVLLIKGRNLYRTVGGFGVRRQPWADEAQRTACLQEKHARGAAARAVRARRKGTLHAAQDQRAHKRQRKGPGGSDPDMHGLPKLGRDKVRRAAPAQAPKLHSAAAQQQHTHHQQVLQPVLPSRCQPEVLGSLPQQRPWVTGATEDAPRLQRSFTLTAQVVGSWRAPSVERQPLQQLQQLPVALNLTSHHNVTLDRPNRLPAAVSHPARHAAPYTAKASFGAPVVKNCGNKWVGGVCMCHCGDSAAKACAYGLCGKCCRGDGCARHGKQLGANKMRERARPW